MPGSFFRRIRDKSPLHRSRKPEPELTGGQYLTVIGSPSADNVRTAHRTETHGNNSTQAIQHQVATKHAEPALASQITKKGISRRETDSGSPEPATRSIVTPAIIDPLNVVKTGDHQANQPLTSLPEGPTSSASVWARAYKRLEKENPIIFDVLRHELGISDAVSLNSQHLKDAVEKKIGDREQEHLSKTLFEYSWRMRERLSKVLNIVLVAQDLISDAVASQPYASLAWTGVLLLLPLLSSAKVQNEAMLDGLDYIASLFPIYRSLEKRYITNTDQQSNAAKPSLVDDNDTEGDAATQLLEVYCQILQYIARTISFLTEKPYARAWKGMIQKNDWTGWLEKLKQADSQMGKLALQAHLEAKEHAQEFHEAQSKSLIKTLDLILQEHTTQRIDREESNRRAFLQILASGTEGGYVADKDVVKDRLEGTCEWFFQNSKYNHWHSSNDSCLLWLTANPGCGKSVLSKHLINELLASAPSTSSTVCYFFFRDGTNYRSSESALSAILHQIISKPANSHLFKHAIEEYNRWGPQLPKQYAAMWSIFEALVHDPNAGEIICIVDALDECSDTSRINLQSSFVSWFSKPSLLENKNIRLKVLTTCRPYPDLMEQFLTLGNTTSCVHFDADDPGYSDMIKKEINIVIEYETPLRVSKCVPDSSDQTKIVRYLQTVEQRTYLWLHLMLQELEENIYLLDDADDITRFLESLPISVETAYCKILERNSTKYRNLAGIILRMIVAARRPLTVAEVSVAYHLVKRAEPCKSIREIQAAFKIDFKALMSKICGLFVVVHNSKVYLIHQTAREYLVRKDVLDEGGADSWQKFTQADAEFTLAKACISLLLLEEIEQAPIPDDEEEFCERLKKKTADEGAGSQRILLADHEIFLEYSAVYWIDHYKCDGSVEKQKMLLRDSSRLCSPQPRSWNVWTVIFMRWRMSILMRDQWKSDVMDLIERRKDEKCGFVIAAYAGLTMIIKTIAESSECAQMTDAQWGLALGLATANDQTAATKQLKDLKDPKLVDPETSQWLLYVASWAGCIDVVLWLLKSGIEPGTTSLTDPYCVQSNISPRFSSLEIAVRREHIEICRLLIEHNADTTFADEWKRTLLHTAALCNTNPAICQLLLKCGVPINAVDGAGDAALSYAAMIDERFPVLNYLLESGASVNLSNKSGRSALFLAVQYDCERNVKTLIDHGADLSIIDDDGDTVVHCAILETCDTTILELLLSSGAPVNVRDELGRAPLHNVVYHSESPTMMKLLINHGAQMNIQDDDKDTVLHLAARAGEFENVKYLVERGASITLRNIRNRTPADVAEWTGEVDIAEWLRERERLSKEKDVTAADVAGREDKTESEVNSDSEDETEK